MNIDLSALWQIVLPLACAAVTVGTPVLVAAANKRLKLANGSAAADDLDQALEHGVALGLDTLKSLAAHNGTVTLPAGWLGSAAALVAKLAPAAISELGITPAEIEALITARVNAHPANPANVPATPAAAPVAPIA